MFANHTAINFFWNFGKSILNNPSNINIYKSFDEKNSERIISKTRSKLLLAETDSILKITKPNVILIIWESLTSKVVGVLGGEEGVTENLNRLSNEGILFTNFYSNGNRTDKGIPSILSGYYSHPVKKVMQFPNKTKQIPMLSKELNKLGYKTSFYYGGDLSFGNMKSYLRHAEMDMIVDGYSFKNKEWSSKWGVYDDIFMKRFQSDLSNRHSPFFATMLTLSSHEPYDINVPYKFGRDTEDNQFRSSHSYTDKVIGDFIAYAKQQHWYKNTLIVIMSDHGHSSPKHNGEYFAPKKFAIPMLWLGGAVNKKGIKVSTISSQVDFSYTLLDLLNGNKEKFRFGKNIFNHSKEQYAYYSFNKGFGILSNESFFLYDYNSKKPITKWGKDSVKLDSLGKAISQDAYQFFLDL